MPHRYTERIVEHLSHDNYQPSLADEIARDMRVDDENREYFDRAVEQLVESGRIIRTGKDRLQLPNIPDEIVGRLRVNRRGFGFVIPKQQYREGDLFIPPGSIGDAISGDTVRAKVQRPSGKHAKRDGNGRVRGVIIEVVQRGREHFVGTLVKRGKEWIIEPDGNLLHDPVVVRDPHAKNASAGDKVVFEMLHYPDDNYLAEGVIVSVLGEAGRPDVETQAVIAAHGLREEFPEEAHEQAREATRAFEKDAQGPWPDREDLTEQFIFTIDPPDARDFDDAISIEHDKKTREWTLGVHIADVSHFVPAGSPLDKEASQRGNSVYLPRHVIPMLPEVLSNGVCSLQEGVGRFTKSVFITFDNRGNVVRQRCASTVIRSRKRLTYLEAQALIDGDEKLAAEHARTEPVYEPQLIEALKLSDSLANILRKRRLRDGMIVLNLPEVQLVFDDDGHVIDAIPEDDAFTHTIIEMFMVEANEALARLFSRLGIPVLRRIHADPVHGDIEELRLFARAAQFNLPDEPSRHDLQMLLEKTRNTPAARAIHFAVLRTLTKAYYGPAIIGHFALASEHYAHFTSPIRRYPDLTLHRAMAAFLEETDNGRNVPKKTNALAQRIRQRRGVLDEAQLSEIGQRCSDSENEAEAAERELREFLVLQFLHENHLGDSFVAVVTGTTRRGVFVSIDRFLVEGMVEAANLPASDGREDQWYPDEATGRMRAKRSGKSIGLGDVVTVQIMRIDLASRQMDLAMSEMPERSAVEHVDDQQRGKGKGKSKYAKGKPAKGKGKKRGHAKRR